MSIVRFFRNIGQCSGITPFLRHSTCVSSSSSKVKFAYLSTKNVEIDIENIVKEKLEQNLQPEYLEVINESAMHNVPKGSATHMRVVIISHLFDDKNLVQRHRMVNEILKDELKGPIHALSIEAVSAKQDPKSVEKRKSPPCKGGMGL